MQSRGIDSEFLNELKRKNDLVGVASNYIQTTQRSDGFWAVCPFHNDKNPSMKLNEEGFYHCFGCHESGDVIKFVQKMENLDFMDAVKFLAERSGMSLPEFQTSKQEQQNKQQKARVLLALDFAYKHYMENLYGKDAKKAQDNIKFRKFTRRELEDFKIGFSKNWTDMVEYLASKGFSEEEMLLSGICGKKNNRLYDFLGERLIFPIFNAFGQCIGFSARALEKTDFAKYKNTPETMVFKKGRVVFGINLLKSQKQQRLLSKIILVEGQMDVIAMHKAGFKSTAACMGTAFTAEHVQELKKLCGNIFLCFDADEAGRKATLRAIEMLRNENVNLKVVKLSGGKDPDEVLQNLGKEKLQQMLDNAVPYMDFLIEHFQLQHNLQNAEEKGKFVKEILAEIKKLGSPALFEPYLEKVRDLTKIPLDILRREISNSGETKLWKKQPEEAPKQAEKSDEKAAKFILAALLAKKDFVDARVDYFKLLEEYGKYLDIISQNQPVSAIFDNETASEDEFLMEILNFNFQQFNKDASKYFHECLWKIAEQKLKTKQNLLNEEYGKCEDLNRRMEIAKALGRLAIALKNKSLEEFNVRR